MDFDPDAQQKSNPLSVCPLNRDVRVGCLYDYNNSEILPEFLEITEENVDYSTCLTSSIYNIVTITTDESDKKRLSYFGIDHHLSQQLDAQKFDMNGLWFYNHLIKDEAFGNCNSDNEFQIIVYLTFSPRTEALTEEFISSNMWNYSDNSNGGTHLVQEVDYGAEFVLRLRKTIDPSKESKQAIKQTMLLSLDTYLYKYFKGTPYTPTLNKMLETMSCSFQSNIGNGFMSSGTFYECLQKIYEMTNVEENGSLNIWRPIRMQLLRIPTKLEIQVAMDWYKDSALSLKDMHLCVMQKCHYMIKSPSFHRLPTLKKTLVRVKELLGPLALTCHKVIDDLEDKHYSPKQYDSIIQPYMNLITRATNWLTKYHEDAERVAFLLEGNNLQVLDLRSINKQVKEVGDVKRTKVFVMHFACKTTDVDKFFKKWTRNPAEDLNVFYSEVNCCGPRVTWQNIYKEWQEFLHEAVHSMDKDVDYAVGILREKSPYKEGTILPISNKEIARAVNRKPTYGNSPKCLHLVAAVGIKRFRQDDDAID